MLKIGQTVYYRDRSNHRRKGKIDKTVIQGGERIYRVNGTRWFQADGLAVG